ncbi:hypothetical protein DL93DRAFT_2102010 [Clavulina sp. PMI_390]|nr:hypothetical protein DL93DRAFT_2102010 [Clavulina sp. PMI_390]
MRAFPFAVLERFSSEGWPFPVNHAQLAKFQRNKRRAPMPIAFVLSKKNVHSRTVVRTTIKRRTLEVLRLIVTKGAHVNSDSVIVFRDEDVGYERWIMKDWIYIYYPTLEMYRRPFYDVIPALRDALETIKSRAQQMEISWQNVNMNQGPSGAASSRVLPMRRNGPTSTPKTSAGRRPRTNSGHTPNSQPPPATSLN